MSQSDSALLPLVSAASRAASSHNTQPWKFELGEDRVRIAPDFTRRCSHVDPDNHHLYASLGCAAENLVLEARRVGYEADVSVTGAGDGSMVEVALARGIEQASPLADAIPHRQCTRAGYDGRSVPSEQLAALERVGTGDGVSCLLITDRARMKALAEWVAEGNRVQLADAGWRAELVEWLRFNEREARRMGDGLWSRSTGNPPLPRALGKRLLRLVLSPESQNAKDVPWILSSAGIAVFVSERDDPAHWVEAGRCYERFALEATAFGLRNAFVNQPVEVQSLRPQFAEWLGIGARRPDLVVRFGHGPTMPPSFRRPLTDVLIEQPR